MPHARPIVDRSRRDRSVFEWGFDTMMRVTIALLIVLVLLLSACTAATPSMPNPASVYCKENGGKLEIRDEDGGQIGYCIFDDGSECEEWAFMRGTCEPGGKPVGMPNPASVYCEEQGGDLDIRNEEGGQTGYCIFDDGSECEEWTFFRGECGPGSKPVGMANPASVHCEEQGGSLNIRDEDGGQAGYCVFPDGSECEEWAFFRGECEPGK